ncbi:hypothetical protein EI94DRAFT_1813136 [Lactarius quietus]|nr:hypothetical protein EI94DRAFT_1813136 [Lactarius quietus]
MAPRTRGSHTKDTAVGAPNSENQRPVSFGGSTLANSMPSTRSRVPARRIIPGNPNQSQVAALGKRTFAQTRNPGEAHVSSSLVIQANPAKKARNVGPIRSRPMPLVLPSENELGISSTFTNGNEGEDMDDSIGKGKGKRLERTSSFYPGRGDHSHALARLDPALSTFHTPDVDDDGSLTEDDPVEDDHAVELALKFPNKFSESLAVEAKAILAVVSQSSTTSVRDAEWTAATSLLTFSLPEYDLGSVTAQLPEGVATGLPNVDATTIFPEAPQAIWPIDTDLVFPEGCNKTQDY